MTTQKIKEIPSLTGLRFFAALFVCSAHLITKITIIPALLPMTQLASEGMSLFFVLSGFVIYYNYSALINTRKIRALYQFFVARFARLFPLYLVCLGADLALTYHRAPSHSLPHLWQAIPYYLTLTQSWFYIIIGDNELIYQFGRMLQVSWSISTEWFFYLCFPFICFAIAKLKTIWSKALLLAFISIISLTGIIVYSLKTGEINDFAIKQFGQVADYQLNFQDSFARWLIYFSPYARAFEFIIGCITAALYMQTTTLSTQRTNKYVGMIVSMLSITLVCLTHYLIWYTPKSIDFAWVKNLHHCFGFALPFAALIYCCAHYDSIVSRFLSNPLLILGGELSYSIYLFHTQLIDYAIFHFTTIASTLPHTFVSFTSILIIIFAFSYITYTLIEVPARRTLRTWLKWPISYKNRMLVFTTK